MAIRLYTDVHIPRAIVVGLRLRDVDVLTAQEDGADEFSDLALLDRATERGRVLITFDDDLLVVASERQRAAHPFTGLVYAHPLRISIGQCIEDLALIAEVSQPDDLENRIEFLPL